MFVEAIFDTSFCFSYVLLGTTFALKHVYKIFRVTVDVVSNKSCFIRGVDWVRGKPVGFASSRRTIVSTLIRASEGYRLFSRVA